MRTEIRTLRPPSMRPVGGTRSSVDVDSVCMNCPVRGTGMCSKLIGSNEAFPVSKRHESKRARQNIVRKGEALSGIMIVREGWAVRYVQLANGKRQVLSIALPGELVSALSVFDGAARFSVQAVTDTAYCTFERTRIRERLGEDPEFLESWALRVLLERDWSEDQLVDLGQRGAKAKVAGFFVRLLKRLEGRGEVKDGRFNFPLRQQHIADLTGLTPVHVCRVVGALKREGLLELFEGYAVVRDRSALEAAADAD